MLPLLQSPECENCFCVSWSVWGPQTSIRRIFIDSSTICYMKKIVPLFFPFSSKSPRIQMVPVFSFHFFFIRLWSLILPVVETYIVTFKDLLWNNMINTLLSRGWNFWHRRFHYYYLSFCSHLWRIDIQWWTEKIGYRGLEAWSPGKTGRAQTAALSV